MTETEFRLLPEVTPENEFFWRGGERNELVLLRCNACRTYVHPPAPICPACLGRALQPEPVSGRGTVLTFTVNHQAWHPGLAVPYVIALVEIDEQSDLRILTNIVGCEPDDVTIGMRVRAQGLTDQ